MHNKRYQANNWWQQNYAYQDGRPRGEAMCTIEALIFSCAFAPDSAKRNKRKMKAQVAPSNYVRVQAKNSSPASKPSMPPPPPGVNRNNARRNNNRNSSNKIRRRVPQPPRPPGGPPPPRPPQPPAPPVASGPPPPPPAPKPLSLFGDDDDDDGLFGGPPQQSYANNGYGNSYQQQGYASINANSYQQQQSYTNSYEQQSYANNNNDDLFGDLTAAINRRRNNQTAAGYTSNANANDIFAPPPPAPQNASKPARQSLFGDSDAEDDDWD